MILVGDIGGTHTRLAMAHVSGSSVTLADNQDFNNVDAADLETLIGTYLIAHQAPSAISLAVAGPTDGYTATLTNLAWTINAHRLQQRFTVPVRLINDFVGIGHGLPALRPEHLHTLQSGAFMADAPRLAVGAGTGLGVVQSLPVQGRLLPLASEGGHIGFAPIDDEQAALLAFLQTEHGRVSVERVCSGPGIEAIYRFCRHSAGRPTTRIRSAAEISHSAHEGSDPQALWAMRLFCRIYGQIAGDLALVAQARGGVYLAGGIAAKNLDLMANGEFIAGFRAKGRFSDWMEDVPVHIVLDPAIGLKGAALAAT